jgi:hypothetical protein
MFLYKLFKKLWISARGRSEASPLAQQIPTQEILVIVFESYLIFSTTTFFSSSKLAFLRDSLFVFSTG